jgi:hypothetical protein
LNWENARASLFGKPEDFAAFERLFAEGRERRACRIPACPFRPNREQVVRKAAA